MKSRLKQNKSRQRSIVVLVYIAFLFAGLYLMILSNIQAEQDMAFQEQLYKPTIERFLESTKQPLFVNQNVEPATNWEAFVQAVDKVAPIYQFPKNVVLAQAALESSRGNSRFAKDRNNFLGIGAFDSNPNSAFHYENPEQCVIQYMQTIKKNFPEAWAKRDNPDELLLALKVNKKGNFYASDKDYVFKVKNMREWSVQ